MESIPKEGKWKKKEKRISNIEREKRKMNYGDSISLSFENSQFKIHTENIGTKITSTFEKEKVF